MYSFGAHPQCCMALKDPEVFCTQFTGGIRENSPRQLSLGKYWL